MNKYLMIVMKELRVIIPLTIITVVLSFIFQIDKVRYVDDRAIFNRELTSLTGEKGGSHFMYNDYVDTLNATNESLLILLSILGVGVGLIQFWMPKLKGNWKFSLHRPISRTALIGCMLTPAIVVIYFTGLAFWYITCLYLDSKTLVPIDSDVFNIGWHIGLIPIAYYLATALTGLNTTKLILSLLPVIMVVVAHLLSTNSRFSSFMLISIMLPFLIMATIITVNNFKNREY